ncbi:MAG: di-heme enzyme [Bdellovibrionales bacterium]|nr:di-heme enzyme [Bdellovibrionales bacterium]
MPFPHRSLPTFRDIFGRWGLILALAIVAGSGCGGGGGDGSGALDETAVRQLLRIPAHMAVPAVPEFNPITAEKIELGRHLFYDKRLSANGTQSCESCHHQSLAFTDGAVRSVGSTGVVHPRNSQGLGNAMYNASFTWSNDTFVWLEDQIVVPIISDNPVELGVTDNVRAEVLSRFETDPLYQSLFAAAFPNDDAGVTLNKIIFALTSFCRALVTSNSPYDRLLAGEDSALTARQLDGLRLFNSERFECFHCHSGINLTVSYRDFNSDPETVTFPFFNNGLYNIGGSGDYPIHDQGLFNLTADPADRGLFRPQSLRNVAVTAPYMHDGSIATLEEVIRHYARGGRLIENGPNAGDGRLNPLKSGLIRGFQATDEEVAAVVAFLKSLTDETFLTDPRFSNPFQ